MKRVALLLALVACSSGDGGSPVVGPLEGRWAGEYVIDTTAIQAEMQLVHSDDQVIGTLILDSGREASVSGTVNGNRLEASWGYIDQCGGQATTTADLVGERLLGAYESTDCNGTTTGEYDLTKQAAP
jgi:hypothetical protein